MLSLLLIIAFILLVTSITIVDPKLTVRDKFSFPNILLHLYYSLSSTMDSLFWLTKTEELFPFPKDLHLKSGNLFIYFVTLILIIIITFLTHLYYFISN